MSDKPSLKQLPPQEWEILIDDFQYDGVRREKWTSRYTSISLIDLALSTLLKRDFFPVKLHVIVFLEEYFDLLFEKSGEVGVKEVMEKLIDALRFVVQAPIDGTSITFAVKEQMMVSVTSILITISGNENSKHHHIQQLESMVELLLTVINRPNHGLDRQARAVACECLRELERANPCLLSEIVGHLWSLCQSERTHASQNYLLLFSLVTYNIVIVKLNVSILNTSVPLVPFNIPQWMMVEGMAGYGKDITGSNYKELRRAIAFLLEWPQVLTPCGLIEFLCMIMPISKTLELQASMLKVQFFGLIYSYDPMLCHGVLMMYLRFPDAFDGHEGEITRCLMRISNETQHYLFFRLLALHWLLGFIGLVSDGEVEKKTIIEMALSFYPLVFDPLALKLLKLDLLALCSRFLEISKLEGDATGGVSGVRLLKLFEEALVSVSAFKWLPPWSTETAVAFRTFHKFLIGVSSHSDTGSLSNTTLMESKIFHSLQRMLVEMILEFQRLVPVTVTFIDRLLGCHKHCWLGERLLQTFDEHLLPKVTIDYKLASYFQIFDRIAENDTVPPRGLLELLTKFMVFLVGKHGSDTVLKSWCQGSQLLGICRTMMMNHHNSRLFLGLSRLFAYTCLNFPDLEVRDNSRIYLRMLICIPGKKLRHILNLEEQLTGISPSLHSNSFFNVQSHQFSHDIRKSRNISSYIHLDRLIPLLVKQSWSLSLPTLGYEGKKTGHLMGIRDSEALVDDIELDRSNSIHFISATERVDQPQEPLRVMDSKISEILVTLRRHFSCIPDFRHMPGLKIKLCCSLRFKSEPFNRIWGVNSPTSSLDAVDALPAIYATVLTFSSSAPYGSLPSYHVPFLLGEPFKDVYSSGPMDLMNIVPVENGCGDEGSFRASVTIELEPREPMPGLVDVFIETNAEDGQVIRGQLESITVGIEDMFLKAIVPPDIPEDAVCTYFSDLFNALWEACGISSNTGRETFPLNGGKGVAAICGTRSVKLLEIPANSLIRAIEHYLAPFVVSVIGEPLVNIVRDGGIIRDIIWKDAVSGFAFEDTSVTDFDRGPLQLKYIDDEDERNSHVNISRRNMGCILVLIFLPPRFHLLFQMEVCDASTLVRVRTDHWPCLAYIDDYLEALFFCIKGYIFI